MLPLLALPITVMQHNRSEAAGEAAVGPPVIGSAGHRPDDKFVAPSLLARPLPATQNGKWRVVYVARLGAPMNDIALETRYLAIETVQARLMPLLKKNSVANPAAWRFGKGQLGIGMVDSETFAGLAAATLPREARQKNLPVLIDLAANRIVFDFARCFDPTGARLSDEGAQALVALLGQSEFERQSRRHPEFLSLSDGHVRDGSHLERQRAVIDDNFSKSVASITRHRLIDPEARLSRTAASMVRQVSDKEIVEAYLYAAPDDIKRAQLAFSVARANEQVRTLLRNTIPRGHDALDQVAGFH